MIHRQLDLHLLGIESNARDLRELLADFNQHGRKPGHAGFEATRAEADKLLRAMAWNLAALDEAFAPSGPEAA